ncbi:MAG TPA: hypothetical protein VGV87_08485 [Blastocatellia bacterium]|nr:hypothetical protein [Blastocatellia bacterium]
MSTQIRERVSKIEIRRPHLSASRLSFSAVEIAAGVIVLLFFFGTLYYYFSALKPEQDRLARLEAQYDLQKKQIALILKPTTDAAPKDTLQDALNSLGAFKTQYLKPRHQGQRALINEINALVQKHGAHLTSGLEMNLENIGQQNEKKKSRSRNGEPVLNPFPQLNMNFTISGQYDKLRAFISDLEKNKQFLMIRSINLIAAAEEADGDTGRRRRHSSNLSGLSLTISLSAYFQP